MAKRKTPETITKGQVRDYLRIRGWFVFHCLQGLGCYAGVSDFIIVKDGRVIFLEIKTLKGVQSENQKKFQFDIEEHGGEYLICRSVEELIDRGL